MKKTFKMKPKIEYHLALNEMQLRLVHAALKAATTYLSRSDTHLKSVQHIEQMCQLELTKKD